MDTEPLANWCSPKAQRARWNAAAAQFRIPAVCGEGESRAAC